MTTDWPFNIADPVRAVHFALEPHCPFSDPRDCPRETEARHAVEAHQQWLATHPHPAQPARPQCAAPAPRRERCPIAESDGRRCVKDTGHDRDGDPHEFDPDAGKPTLATKPGTVTVAERKCGIDRPHGAHRGCPGLTTAEHVAMLRPPTPPQAAT